MATYRPSAKDEERFKKGEVLDEVYQATADYIYQVSNVFETMPEKVQKASSELLDSDQITSTALSQIEAMVSSKDSKDFDMGKICGLVGAIFDESARVNQVNDTLINQLLEDEQTVELYF